MRCAAGSRLNRDDALFQTGHPLRPSVRVIDVNDSGALSESCGARRRPAG